MAKASLLCAIFVVVILVVCGRPLRQLVLENYVSYTMDVFAEDDQGVLQPFTLWFTNVTQRARIDDITDKETSLLFPPLQTSFTVTPDGCDTFCVNGSLCPPQESVGCAFAFLSPFQTLPNATYAGSCAPGEWWNATAAVDTIVSFCLSQDGTQPLYLYITTPEESFLWFKVARFESGPPPDSLFQIPASCPCL